VQRIRWPYQVGGTGEGVTQRIVCLVYQRRQRVRVRPRPLLAATAPPNRDAVNVDLPVRTAARARECGCNPAYLAVQREAVRVQALLQGQERAAQVGHVDLVRGGQPVPAAHVR
jgi:hypothetical protein